MKLKTIIQNLEKKRQAYIRKHGYEPVVWDFEADAGSGDLIIDLVKGKKKLDWGATAATSERETVYVKWSK